MITRVGLQPRLLLPVLVFTAASGTLLRHSNVASKFIPVADESEFAVPTCSCRCCQAARRLPSEVTVPNLLTCALDESLEEKGTAIRMEDAEMPGQFSTKQTRCPDTCVLAEKESAVAATSSLEPTKKQRSNYHAFCSEQCEPIDLVVGTPCHEANETVKVVPFSPGGPPSKQPTVPCLERSPCVTEATEEKASRALWWMVKAREEADLTRQMAKLGP
mmetsp:Transcript_34885/g.76136  ORF Transcript_34885/g.76136 Transcript_34885/m.76136 type:complete len:218 (-) Transcript_34885:163-816(-)